MRVSSRCQVLQYPRNVPFVSWYAHIDVSIYIYRCMYVYMGWPGLVGSLKLYVSFAEYRLF